MSEGVGAPGWRGWWWPRWRPRRGFQAAARGAPSSAAHPKPFYGWSSACASHPLSPPHPPQGQGPSIQPPTLPKRQLACSPTVSHGGSSPREPHKPLKTCRGTFQHSEPGRRERASPAPTGLSPSSARWRFTCPPTCGDHTHRSKGRRNGTSRLKPQQVHRHGQHRTAVWAGRPPDPGQGIEPSHLFTSHRQQRHVTRVPNSQRRGKHRERTHTVAHVAVGCDRDPEEQQWGGSARCLGQT